MTTLALGATLLGGPASADVHCSVPLADWQPREALQRKLEAEGWTVTAIRADDGCYKVRATNARGERLEGKFDPARLEPVRRKTQEDDED
ncbi:PepSY domain-containing protein [Methylobacterium nodulans]|uniref:PepSY domain-containing protein n=1 Tax=Methylobacterium nodulans (strain LMG 21967 / CNCM I-2342 / ORS 2060) TaxID=460265 RepID=B8IJI3_METNO|nr:PepSY domain-containing protein [Methylobacterium nodulans]ACL58031.1 conserved hypothetical protein [Methylobacterium nodulans ORS 2060]